VLMLEALVQGYMKTYFLSAAVNCLDMWLDRDPDDPQAYFWRGEVLEILHKYEEALADYQRAVDLAPDRDDARLKLADGLLHAQGARAAAPHYETLYERQPGEPEVLLGLARCRLELGETDEARRLLDALLAAQPRDGAFTTPPPRYLTTIPYAKRSSLRVSHSMASRPTAAASSQ
jgi:tetratricopeptide (TPR) repeat protein